MSDNYLIEYFKMLMRDQKLSHLYLIETTFDVRIKKSLIIDLVYEFLKTDIINPEILKKMIIENNYPNFYYLRDDKNISVGKQQILEMYNYFTQTSLIQKKKIYVIESIEKISYNAANSLLYFLENPINENILGILLTEDRNLVLPTIVSRAQLLCWHPCSQNYLSNISDLQKDILDKILFNLLKEVNKQEIYLLNKNYFFNLKKFFLIFLENFPKTSFSNELLYETFNLMNYEYFFNDFLFILSKFFLDLLFYQKTGKTMNNFPSSLFEINNLFSLPEIEIINWLKIFNDLEPMSLKMENKFCWLALILEIKKK
ncbi:MAG: hypothetical protein Q8764_00490 [Pigeon pea little leaf phytoplasma]|uniref:DNA polymerase III subunit delta n=1 Tax=Candidatus Phytoplasma fabacearum TaxID=2982628 RepID=A0ABU8ZRW9_9MOLU|nr:hypothetical protein ['Bituminaria bituminosa' little leaf phytoplasma]MDV3148861.1 hypothetical protein [Pigeon pea little leaf phytoplasma]MDO7983395.1 hypothetical protein ['Bituminaria bituminosa' little leaf phytoplasma]MDO8023870.1 hypothetical protein ['Bituminaria bituminosa' little leaf phytoplasma]MDO8030616.1 hypothetical protein ['Bituminaria bituminosa' little leaf phytoplasma]MDV3153936.1 hypothetical protein [Pigeon pea little leaf phytoplasma]